MRYYINYILEEEKHSLVSLAVVTLLCLSLAYYAINTDAVQKVQLLDKSDTIMPLDLLTPQPQVQETVTNQTTPQPIEEKAALVEAFEKAVITQIQSKTPIDIPVFEEIHKFEPMELNEIKPEKIVKEVAEPKTKTPTVTDTASLAKKVVAKAFAIERKHPVYPKRALQRGHKGSCIVRILVNQYGTVEWAKIDKSTGYASLDESALHAINSWKFNPALNGLKHKIASEITVPIEFKLN